MPRISFFYGIAIYMYFNDHRPPHFHARYSGDNAAFAIDTLECIEGQLPPRATALVREWAAHHRDALGSNWERARVGHPLVPVEPLV